jgi:arylsulfatase A-like enzyme
MIDGKGFAAGTIRQNRAAVVDLAPTIPAHLGHATGGMDGTALQRAKIGEALEQLLSPFCGQSRSPLTRLLLYAQCKAR